MKKILKYAFLSLAALSVMTSCSNDDTYDVVGLTGNRAYIEGGTEALFRATECTIYHVPDGEEGEITMTLTAGITKARATATTIAFTIDNSLVTDPYTAIPDGILTVPNLTIPAGETSASQTLTIAQSDFPQLPLSKYMVPIRIASSDDVAISTNSNAAYLLINAITINPADNLVGVASTSTTKFTITKYTNEITGSVSKDITLTGSESAYKDFTATLKVDNSLIPADGGYLAVPDGMLTLTDAQFAAGATSATATVSIPAEKLASFTEAGTYLVPVVVDNVGSASLNPNSAVTYLEITVKIFDYSSNFFSALYLGSGDLATNYVFAKPIDLSADGFTITFYCFIDELTEHSRIGDFCNASEDWINMLRFGQKGNDKGILEWFVGPTGSRKYVYSTTSFKEKTWYQVGLCFNGTNYDLYVNGKLESSVAAAENTAGFNFQRWEFNSSWGGAGYRNGNEFHGRIMEVSIFNWSFTDAGGKSGTWFSYCNSRNPGMYNAILGSADYYGLAAYWPCHDGVGGVLEEKSGLYENVDFAKTARDDGDGSMTPTDVTPYVTWVADQYNNFSE